MKTRNLEDHLSAHDYRLIRSALRCSIESPDKKIEQQFNERDWDRANDLLAELEENK